MIATGFGSGIVEAALRPAAQRHSRQQQQQRMPPRQVPMERWAARLHGLIESGPLHGLATAVCKDIQDTSPSIANEHVPWAVF